MSNDITGTFRCIHSTVVGCLSTHAHCVGGDAAVDHPRLCRWLYYRAVSFFKITGLGASLLLPAYLWVHLWHPFRIDIYSVALAKGT